MANEIQMVRNPFFELAPNMRCPCFSGKKFKACCRKVLSEFVTLALANEYRDAMKEPDRIKFVFEEEPKQAECHILREPEGAIL